LGFMKSQHSEQTHQFQAISSRWLSSQNIQMGLLEIRISSSGGDTFDMRERVPPGWAGRNLLDQPFLFLPSLEGPTFGAGPGETTVSHRTAQRWMLIPQACCPDVVKQHQWSLSSSLLDSSCCVDHIVGSSFSSQAWLTSGQLPPGELAAYVALPIGSCVPYVPDKVCVCFWRGFSFYLFSYLGRCFFHLQHIHNIPPPLRFTPRPPVWSPGLAVTTARPR